MSARHSDVRRIGRELDELARASTSTHGLSIGVCLGSTGASIARYRDFGVVLERDAFSVHVGGEAGAHPRPGPLLGRSSNERVLLEYAGAFLQLHFDESRPQESAAEFVRRVGIDYVRERVVKDPRGRAALFRVFYGTTGCPCPI